VEVGSSNDIRHVQCLQLYQHAPRNCADITHVVDVELQSVRSSLGSRPERRSVRIDLSPRSVPIELTES
jgi:hypothetical protein